MAQAGVTVHAATLSYTGRVVDAAGAPLVGPADIVVRFFGSAAGSDQLGTSQTFAGVALSGGVFQLSLTLSDAEVAEVLGDGSRSVYVEVEAAGVVYPRQLFAAVPLALRVPIDNDKLVYADGSRLTVDHVSMSQVSGLEAALAAKMDQTPASSTSSGYLSASDWAQFDAKQAAITSTSTVDAGSLSSTQQSGLLLRPFGAGIGQTGELRFAERTGGNFVGFRAPDAVGADQVWTLPSADGTSGSVLATDGAGALSWVDLGLGALATQSTVAGGGGGTITDDSITNADIAASAAIADTKLATIATAGKVSGAAITSGAIGGTAAFTGSGGVTTTGAITGTGNVLVSGTGAATTELRFGDNDNSHYVGLKGPGMVGSNLIWTLPALDGGSGQFLRTDGSGTLSWGSPAGGGDVMASANLGDLASPAAARANLGLGALATASTVSTAEISDGTVTNADISGTAAIATSKLSGAVTQVAGHGLGSLATLSAVGSGDITDGAVVDADVSAAAAIATSKLSGAVTSISGHGLGALAAASTVGSSEITDGSVASADISDGTITDADVSGTAQLATSKLSGAVTAIAGHGLGALATRSAVGSSEIDDNAIANADVSPTAAIATSKISGALTAISGHGLGALAALSAVGSNEISNGAVTDADVSGTAAIATSKLSGALTSVTGHGLGALATLSNVGSGEITNGSIVDADISGTAAISASKISFVSDSISGNAIDGGVISNFQSTGIDDNAAAVAVTIASGGNVGIGTTSPINVLTVQSPTQFMGLQVRNATNRIAELVGGSAVNEGGILALYNNASQDVTIRASGTSWLNGGNVGIGTTAPSTLLQVGSLTETMPATNTGVLKVTGPTRTSLESVGGIELPVAGDGYGVKLQGLAATGAALAFARRFNSATWTESMRIDANGNVGIGTASPGSRLSVNGAADFTGNVGIGTTSPGVQLQVYGASGAQSWLRDPNSGFKFATSGGSNFIESAGAGMTGSAPLHFTNMNAANVWMTIGSSGNVGIGTTSPTTALTVNGELIRQVQRAKGNGPVDTTDNGALATRTLTFVKRSGTATSVRVAYHDNFRVSHVSSTAYSCRWEVKLNGASCPSGSLHQDYHSQFAGQNDHQAGAIVGYCDNLAAGTYTIQAYVSSPSPGGGSSGDCYTGWYNSHWVIEAEEIF
jgi:hypothetical protein